MLDAEARNDQSGFVCGDNGEASALHCSRFRPLARIDNHWHLANHELGQLIAACTLKHPSLTRARR
jgi:hypothetical protein